MPRFIPWIGVHHGTGAVNAEETSVRSEIKPITITNGVMAIRADGPVFTRGDCNGDGSVTGSVADTIFLLNFLFGGGRTPPCSAACNVNGDDRVNMSDAISLLNYNFGGGPPPAPPYPGCDMGSSPVDTELGCEISICES